MNAKVGETTRMPVREQTIDGVLINVYLKAALVNVSLDPLTDFLRNEIVLTTNLFRNKETHNVTADNLELLGLYSSLNYGVNNWIKGNVIVYKDVAVKEERLITLFLPFGGPINVKGDDTCNIEMLVGRSVFTADIDGGVSYIEFSYNNAIGYEWGTPQIRSQVVNEGISNDKYSIGDNVTKLAFIQLDKDNISDNVLVQLSINSTQWSANLNFFDILNRHWNALVSPVIQYRYGATQPFTLAAPGDSAQPFLPAYPQSVILFAGTRDTKSFLDNCQISATFRGANVNSSKNYFMATTMRVTKELVEKAIERQVKHSEEKQSTIPVN